eukprot:gene11397-4564_t
MVVHVRLTFVRHGETDWNKEGKCQGNLDISLNKNGIKQAEKVSKKFILETEPKPNLVISSSLSRAKTTAKSIHETLEKHHKTEIPFFETNLLQERGLGEYQGNSFQNIKEDLTSMNIEFEEFPQPRLYHCLNHISSKKENSTIETSEQLNKRVSDAIQFILDKTLNHYSKEENLKTSSKLPYNIIVVSHGLFLSGLIGNLFFSNDLHFPVRHSNTGVSSIVVEVEKKDTFYDFSNPLILHMNDTTHHHFE